MVILDNFCFENSSLLLKQQSFNYSLKFIKLKQVIELTLFINLLHSSFSPITSIQLPIAYSLSYVLRLDIL